MAAFNELLKKIKQINPDIIQGWMYHDNLMASLGKILTRNNAVLVWNVRHSLLDLSSKGLNTQWVIKNSKWFSKQVNTVIYNTYFQLYKSLI
ncbi:MAG: hypothetical protein COB24_00035 [Hyphomicrobiales bacterium]|nr:MAG: hypothetical protein COB24_00035 [Hyphomicrobiales bacterium]